jgi:glycerophosphoryl diester phosphodiesterase
MIKAFAIVLIVLLGLISFQYFHSGNPKDIVPKDDLEIIAHRGAHVMWKQGAYDPITGCEATHIFQPTPQQTYIENTLESIGKAFEYGATLVEIDIRLSKDNILVVNHEENLECKTNGTGKIYAHTLEQLKKLDVGYGFTPDSGKTYPYRGKGIGKMPTLQEVLDAFPDKKFLLDHKDRQQKTAEILATKLKKLPSERRKLIYYWGSPEKADYIKKRVPEVTRLFATKQDIKQCLIPYVASIGFLGFGEECRNQRIGMKKKFSKYFWGWPYQFLKRAQENNSPVYLFVDTKEEIEWAKSLPVDGIITDNIEKIGVVFT